MTGWRRSWARGQAMPTTNQTVAPVLLAGGNQVTFTYRRGMSPPAPHERYITNGGTGNLNFTVTDDAAWLSASPAQGSAPGKLTITANPTGKQPGTYTGHVTVAASGASGSPQVITVTLRVTASEGTTYLPLLRR